MSLSRVHVVGAGLAGSEAAFFLAERGVPVTLHEMRPARLTPAHQTGGCAELVCSNSFKSKDPESAPGLLKAEMAQMGSLVLQAAAQSEVPGGQAMAVDRAIFSAAVTKALRTHPNIQFVDAEAAEPPRESEQNGACILATGPLTSDSMSQWLARATGAEDLYFYDAIAPIIDTASIDMNHAFLANRHGKSLDRDATEAAYLNCPMNEAEYYAFVDALLAAEKVPPKNFEQEKFFQGCQPIEAIAASGRDSLRFGPMKPVGLDDPRTGRRPFAVLQLRPENASRTAYNLVGFQTKLKYGEQKRVFQMIPALKQAEFLRLGSIHRNTYVCGPRALRPDLSLKGHPRVYLAGQITGVEGYLESAACGLLTATFAWQRLAGRAHDAPAPTSAIGALLRHIIASDPKNYQPANMQFGLFDPAFFENLANLKKDALRTGMIQQGKAAFASWWGRQQARDRSQAGLSASQVVSNTRDHLVASEQ